LPRNDAALIIWGHWSDNRRARLVNLQLLLTDLKLRLTASTPIHFLLV